jgi:hypothetical protein
MEEEVIKEEIPVNVEETAAVSPLDRMRNMDRFKDVEYESESAALEDALSALEELEPVSKEGAEFKEAIFELLNNVPELGYLFDDYKKTGNFMVSLQSLFENPEDILLKEGDEGYDIAQKRRADFLEREKINTDLLGRMEQTKESAPLVFSEFIADIGASETEADAFNAYAMDLAERIATGELGKEELKKLWQAFKYEEDVAAIDEDLSIASMNSEIPQEDEEDFALPSGSTPATKQPAVPKTAMTVADELEQYGFLK